MNDQELLSCLEKDGKFINSCLTSIYQPKEKINSSAEQIFFLFHNIISIESENIVTGLLFNLRNFITLEIGENEILQLWSDFVNASLFVNSYPNLFGLIESLRTLTYLYGEVHTCYLEFLSNRDITEHFVRPYALEAVYDYLPGRFFTADEETQMFFAKMISSSLNIGSIQHRSFMAQLLFAVHLDKNQINNINDLSQNLWNVIFDIALEDNFAKLLAPVKKLKILLPDYFNCTPFEMNGESMVPIHYQKINDALDSIEVKMSNESSFNECFSFMLNLFKIFPYFPNDLMLRFLNIALVVFSRLDHINNGWKDIKTISHLIYDIANGKNNFTKKQVDALFKFFENSPKESPSFFISTHFCDLLSEYYDFRAPLIYQLCMWKSRESFNPLIFCYCFAQLDEFLFENEHLFNTDILPSIFHCLELKSDLIIYEGVKALTHFYREDLIKIENILETIFDFTLKSAPSSMQFYFKLINEIEDHTRNASFKKDPNNYKIHKKIEGFVRENLQINGLSVNFYGYLLDIYANIITPKENEEFIIHCLNLCNTIFAYVNNALESFRKDKATQNELNLNDFLPLPQISSFILNVNRSFDNFTPQILELYQKIIHFLNNNELIKVPQIKSDTAYFCSYISLMYDLKQGFDFPMKLILDFLNSNIDILVQCGLNIVRRFIPIITKDFDSYTAMINMLLSKVVEIAKLSSNVQYTNQSYNIFAKILKSYTPNNQFKIENISHLVNEMKYLGFQEKLNVMHNQSIYRITFNHFDFFKFIEKLIRKINNEKLLKCRITQTEFFLLIQWISYIPNNILYYLLMPIYEAIDTGIYQNNHFYAILWKALVCKFNEIIIDINKNKKIVISIIDIMDLMISNSPIGIEPSEFLKILEILWKVDFTSEYDDDYDFDEILPPITLNAYAESQSILDFNFSILNTIGEMMIEGRYKWDYQKMLFDIIKIYDKMGTLHLFSNTGARVLFTFALREERASSPNNHLFDTLVLKLGDMIDKDSRILEYLRNAYTENQEIQMFIENNFVEKKYLF